MDYLKEELIYMPSYRVMTATVPEHLNQDYYTLTYIPGQTEARVEKSTEARRAKLFNVPFDIFVKDFITIVEDNVADHRYTRPKTRFDVRYGRVPNHMKWRRKKEQEAVRTPVHTKVKGRTPYSPKEPQLRPAEQPKEQLHVLDLLPFPSQSPPHSPSVRPICKGDLNDDQSLFENMTSAEMHRYFNQKVAENSKYIYKDPAWVAADRLKHPDSYGDDSVYGKQYPDIPEDSVYDTDSPMETLS